METATERTPAQAEASRSNGTKSSGPVTALGKSSSSVNGIAHGPAETTIALTLADLAFRTDRLARLEEKLVSKAIEAELDLCARRRDCG